MKILVVGSGAREHAIVRALLDEASSGDNPSNTTLNHTITVAPGNAGIAMDVPCVELDILNPSAVAALATSLEAELVIVGPEAPLVAGVADAIRAEGIPVFGPNKSAAALEGSKAFAKRIMDAANVPTGRAVTISDLSDIESALSEFGAPYVIKADGLAAGKGVLVTEDKNAAIAHCEYWLEHGSLLVEEFLDGQEISLFVLSDGHNAVPLSPAQDFKRVFNNDEGPNTGGMGSYSPLPWLTDSFSSEQVFSQEVLDTIALPVIRQLESEGTPFIGLLYCGLIMTRRGIRVIEFNARFGDPETQVVLPRLETPLSALLYAAATGDLAGREWPKFSPDVTVSVVLASENYPEDPVTGRPITGLTEAGKVEGVHVVHAATKQVGHDILATGGRVLNVVARAHTFAEARAAAYQAMSRIELEGSHYRTDIAAKVVEQ